MFCVLRATGGHQWQIANATRAPTEKKGAYYYERKPKVMCAHPSQFPAEFLEDTPVRSRDSRMKQQANYLQRFGCFSDMR